MLILLKCVLKLYKINICVKGGTEIILQSITFAFNQVSLSIDNAKVRKKTETTKCFYDFNITLTFGLFRYKSVLCLCPYVSDMLPTDTETKRQKRFIWLYTALFVIPIEIPFVIIEDRIKPTTF
jgi:hypothetical protein